MQIFMSSLYRGLAVNVFSTLSEWGQVWHPQSFMTREVERPLKANLRSSCTRTAHLTHACSHANTRTYHKLTHKFQFILGPHMHCKPKFVHQCATRAVFCTTTRMRCGVWLEHKSAFIRLPIASSMMYSWNPPVITKSQSNKIFSKPQRTPIGVNAFHISWQQNLFWQQSQINIFWNGSRHIIYSHNTKSAQKLLKCIGCAL